jgi:hypothetical protein
MRLLMAGRESPQDPAPYGIRQGENAHQQQYLRGYEEERRRCMMSEHISQQRIPMTERKSSTTQYVGPSEGL